MINFWVFAMASSQLEGHSIDLRCKGVSVQSLQCSLSVCVGSPRGPGFPPQSKGTLNQLATPTCPQLWRREPTVVCLFVWACGHWRLVRKATPEKSVNCLKEACLTRIQSDHNFGLFVITKEQSQEWVLIFSEFCKQSSDSSKISASAKQILNLKTTKNNTARVIWLKESFLQFSGEHLTRRVHFFNWGEVDFIVWNKAYQEESVYASSRNAEISEESFMLVDNYSDGPISHFVASTVNLLAFLPLRTCKQIFKVETTFSRKMQKLSKESKKTSTNVYWS